MSHNNALQRTAPRAAAEAERMSEGVKKLLSEALLLPLDERAQLAEDLIASLDGEPDRDVEAVWAAEIERRASRALAGGSEGRPWREVLTRLDPERGE